MKSRSNTKIFIKYLIGFILIVVLMFVVGFESEKLYSNPKTFLTPKKQVSFLGGSYFKNPHYLKSMLENYKWGKIDLTTMMQKTITELYSPLINVKEQSQKFSLDSRKNTNLNPGIDTTRFELKVGNFDICNSDLVVHNHKDFESPIVFGTLPEDPDVKFIPDRSHFPDPTRTQAIIYNKLIDAYPDFTPKISVQKLCLYPQGNELVPAVVFDTLIDNKPYTIISDDRNILSFKKNFFSVDGIARIFDKNRAGGLKDIPIYGLDGSGYLSDSHFYTSQPSRAYNTSNVFNYDEHTNQFKEVSVFKNTQDYLNWFSSLGFSWYESKKIKLIPNAIIEGTSNNAYFSPASSASEDPAIYVGIGDGVILKDLCIDRDVANHEFGHFVVYSALKNASDDSESLVIHEGLADFFVMMRNQSPCFGSTVCPDGSSMCMGQCLRTAKNSITANSPLDEAHAKSLFISGMLWDMYESDKIPYNDLLTIVFKSISLLGNNSGYHDFIASMLVSDLSNFDMKYCPSILSRAYARGLASYISDLQCNRTLISTYMINRSSGTSNRPASSGSKSSSSSSFCGSITPTLHGSNSDSGSSSGGGASMSLALIPILAILFLVSRAREEDQKESI